MPCASLRFTRSWMSRKRGCPRPGSRDGPTPDLRRSSVAWDALQNPRERTRLPFRLREGPDPALPTRRPGRSCANRGQESRSRPGVPSRPARGAGKPEGKSRPWAPVALRGIVDSPDRSWARPLRRPQPTQVWTMLIPAFVPSRPWPYLLHNQSALRLKGTRPVRPGSVGSISRTLSAPWRAGRRPRTGPPGRGASARYPCAHTARRPAPGPRRPPPARPAYSPAASR